MRMISKYNPKAGIADFWHEFRRPNPYRWPILIASMCMTGTLIWLVGHEELRGPPARPEVTYITTFAEGRSEEEIIANIEANQARQDALRAEAERRAERQRELYRTLGRATGIDVDAMEAEIEAERAAEAASENDAAANAGDAAEGSVAPDGGAQ